MSLTKPAFYIPQPQHSLVDVIAHSDGIVPGQEPIFSSLLDYLLALNPTVVDARIRQVVNGGGEFAPVDTARSFVPADPAERGVYEFLARLSSFTKGGGLLLTGLGWGVALVASAVARYFAQEAGKAGGKVFYDQFDNHMDLANASEVTQLCR